MRRRFVFAVLLVVACAASAQALMAPVKLPKCSAVKCRTLGCPADVLCVAGSQVKTCADVCHGS